MRTSKFEVFLYAFILLTSLSCQIDKTTLGTTNTEVIVDSASSDLSGKNIVADSLIENFHITIGWQPSGYITAAWQSQGKTFIDSTFLHKPLEESLTMNHNFIITSKYGGVKRTNFCGLDSAHVLVGIMDGSWNVNYILITKTVDNLSIKNLDFFNSHGIMVNDNYLGLFYDELSHENGHIDRDLEILSFINDDFGSVTSLKSIKFNIKDNPELFESENDDKLYQTFVEEINTLKNSQ